MMSPDNTKKNKRSSRDVILQYLHAGASSNEEDLVLTKKQQQLFERWKFAAAKLREQKYSSEQVAKIIMGTFDVCRDTAYRYMANAKHVVGSPLSKNSIAFAREIEKITKNIRRYKKKIKEHPDKHIYRIALKEYETQLQNMRSRLL